MELVGARISVIDATKRELIGKSGIITACSQNCYYVAVDNKDGKVDDVIKHGTVKVDTLLNEKDDNMNDNINSTNIKNDTNSLNDIRHNDGIDTKSINHDIDIKKNKSIVAAIKLVRAHVIIGVMLPVLIRKERLSSSTDCFSHTVSGADSSSEVISDQMADEEVQVAVLYGKHFMPHAR